MGSISFIVFSDILMGVWTSQVAQNPSADEGDGVLTPDFLPEKSHGQRNLGGSSPWGHKSGTRLSD